MNENDKPGRQSPDGPQGPGPATSRADGTPTNGDLADLADPGAPSDGPHARRDDGPRRTVNEPVLFDLGAESLQGWTLNVSNGGLRAVVEADLAVGARVGVRIGDADITRPAKVVWARQERGGAVVGLAFLDRPDGTISDIPMPPPESDAPKGD